MMKMSGSRRRPRLGHLLPVLGLSLAALAWGRPAQACGGFFCSAVNPVNQAAERIVFAKNNDGTVTAMIEIKYQGPSTNFSWLLPISSVPTEKDILLASTAAFDKLQRASDPQYNLTVKVEGTCDQQDTQSVRGSANFAPSLAEDGAGGQSGNGGVRVDASGIVGAFEWTVISVTDPKTTDPAQVAVDWLKMNGYDVPDGAPGLLGPYLEGGMHLLALKLKKGASTGSIRPIILNYAADKPIIPIKLTAVAANDDMGVLTWILGNSRAVPQNYNALELNEARINWFNASANYNQVVTAAANDAGGQGFVTEQAGPTTAFDSAVWSTSDESQWMSVSTALAGALPEQVYSEMAAYYSGLDGFWDAVTAHATLPANVTIEQLKTCPDCYSGVKVDDQFVSALESEVIEPMRRVQKLISAYPQITRLYTTMSANEMTVDPLFTFNPDLDVVNNIHTATRVIECSPGYFQDEAPWRIELPQGGVIRGGPNYLGNWPTAFDSQPSNRLILRQGESGQGKVLEDNTKAISGAEADYNKTVIVPAARTSSVFGGCSLGGAPAVGGWLFALAGLGIGALRRRRAR